MVLIDMNGEIYKSQIHHIFNTFNFQIEKFNNVTVYMWCSLISSLFENLTNCLFNIIFKFTDHNAFAFVQLE